MSFSLSEKKFALILQTFAQEVGIAVLGYVGTSSSMKVTQLSHYFPQNTFRKKHVTMH